jgi:O-antigen/teichoic acid export membrane protein
MATEGTTVNRMRAAASTFAGSTATTLLVSIQALVMMPLYMIHIGPRMYGAWLATGEMLVLMLAFDMGIPNIIIQRIGAALAISDKKAIGAYFGTGATILCCFALILSLLLAMIAPFVPTWVHLTGSEAQLLQNAFLLDIVAICLMLVNFIFQGLARGLQETTTINISSFVATLIGFGTTLLLLLSGHGLWSIAIGVTVRAVLTLLGSVLFLMFGVDKEIRSSLKYDREVAKEFRKLSPPMFAAGVSYGFMNNSQVLLAALLLGPEKATIFGLTRKAADVARNVLDAVGNASYGGFANLFAAGDKKRSQAVYREIIAVYLAVGLALMCAYTATNPSLVGVWVSKDMFGGSALTILIAISTLIGGWSYLTLSLFRSTNHHKAVSSALLIECLCRLPAMVGFLLLFGLPGLPIGTICTGLVSGIWAHFKIRDLTDTKIESDSRQRFVWGARITMFIVGIVICTLSVRPSWGFVLGIGGSLALITGALFLGVDPLLERVRSKVIGKFGRISP